MRQKRKQSVANVTTPQTDRKLSASKRKFGHCIGYRAGKSLVHLHDGYNKPTLHARCCATAYRNMQDLAEVLKMLTSGNCKSFPAAVLTHAMHEKLSSATIS
jgi:hypothetical protein